MQRLSETARVPRVMQPGDVAADLYASEDLVIPARGRAVVPTGIAIELPPGFRGRIHPRSGLAARHGIDAGAGLIDESYRGAIGVLLFNHSDEPFEVKVGDRIAQLSVEPYFLPAFQVVEAVSATARSGGWGSSGMT